MIRNARMDDVKTIHSLLNHFAAKGLLLGRSISSLYDHLRDFIVCADETGHVLGVAAPDQLGRSGRDPFAGS